jgi:biopolymer transport protein ExbD
MRAAAASAEHKLQSDINVLPMIDILLVLLVVFMLAQEGRKVLDLNLPPPSEAVGPDRHPAPQIVLQLRADGSYAINGTAVRRDLLGRRLRELYLERPVKVLFVQAEPGRRYQQVIDAADIARDAGVQVIGFVPRAAPPAAR